MRKKIRFTVDVNADDSIRYLDDGTMVPAIREAMFAFMVKGLFDQSFNPSPPLPFDSNTDGAINRYSVMLEDGKERPFATLTGFKGKVDGLHEITINIAAIEEVSE